MPWYVRPRFWLGMLTGVVLLFGSDTVSYGILPLSMIAPFGGLPIIISAVLSETGACGVREPLENIWLDGGAMLAVFTGVTIVSIVTVSTGFVRENLETLAADALGNPVFITLGAIALCLDVCWIGLHLIQPLRAVTIDVWEADGATWRTMLVSAGLASTNAGFQQVFMKTISEAIHELAHGVPSEKVVGNWATWAAIFGLIIFIIFTGIVVQILLGPGRSIALAVPAYQSLALIVTIAVGAYFLHELEVNRSLGGQVLFALGVVLVLVGLCALSYRLEVTKAKRKARKEQELEEQAAAASKAEHE